MKNDILPERIAGIEQDGTVLRALRSIEQKLAAEITAKQDLVDWQRAEIKRLQAESAKKSDTLAEQNTRIIECRSRVEGYRQLINKLIFDINKLQQNIDWYKRTYESRSLLGVIKDKLKHFLS